MQVLDPLKMARAKVFAIPTAPFDLTATDKGLVFVTGSSGNWTEITAIDAKTEAVAARWGGVWSRSFLQLAADQERLYFATQGVTPGQVESLHLPKRMEDKPVQYRSPATDQPLGGDFVLTPDGKHLLSKNGTVLRLSASRDDDLKYATTMEPFLTAAVSPEMKVVVTATKDNLLKVYSYPDFKLQATHRLGVVAYQAAIDAKQGRLYLGTFDPKTLTERPRGRGLGEVRVYELRLVDREAEATTPSQSSTAPR